MASVPPIALTYAAFEDAPAMANRGRHTLEIYAYGWLQQKIEIKDAVDAALAQLQAAGRFERHGALWVDMVAARVTDPTTIVFNRGGLSATLDELPDDIVESVAASLKKRPK